MILGDDRVATSPPTTLRPPVISGHRRIPLGGRVTPGGPRPGAAQSQAAGRTHLRRRTPRICCARQACGTAGSGRSRPYSEQSLALGRSAGSSTPGRGSGGCHFPVPSVLAVPASRRLRPPSGYALLLSVAASASSRPRGSPDSPSAIPRGSSRRSCRPVSARWPPEASASASSGGSTGLLCTRIAGMPSSATRSQSCCPGSTRAATIGPRCQRAQSVSATGTCVRTSTNGSRVATRTAPI